MPEQKEPPRPHGDPLEEEVVSERGSLEESNPAQRQSDATDDAADGAKRKQRYGEGAELVSRID